MAIYKDRINYVDHNFNSYTLTIDGDHVAQSLDSVEVELDDDEVDVTKVADGTGVFDINPSRSGTIKFSMLEASVTNDKMYELREVGAAFSVSGLDTSRPNYNCNGKKMRIVKPPVELAGTTANVVEWICKAVYLDVKGGSYSIQAE